LIVWNSPGLRGFAASIAYCLVLAVTLPRAANALANGDGRLVTAVLFAGLALYPPSLPPRWRGRRSSSSTSGLFQPAPTAGGLKRSADSSFPGPCSLVLPVFPREAPAGRFGASFGTNARAPRPTPGITTTEGVLNAGASSGHGRSRDSCTTLKPFLRGRATAGTLLMPLRGVHRRPSFSLARRNARTRPRGRGATGSGGNHVAATGSLGFFPDRAALGRAGSHERWWQSPNPVHDDEKISRTGREPVRSDADSHPHESARPEGRTCANRGGSPQLLSGTTGNYIHLLTGLPNALLYERPRPQLTNGPIVRDAGLPLPRRPTPPRGSSFHPPTTAATGPDICGSYHAVNVAGLPPRTLFARKWPLTAAYWYSGAISKPADEWAWIARGCGRGLRSVKRPGR